MPLEEKFPFRKEFPDREDEVIGFVDIGTVVTQPLLFCNPDYPPAKPGYDSFFVQMKEKCWTDSHGLMIVPVEYTRHIRHNERDDHFYFIIRGRMAEIPGLVQ